MAQKRRPVNVELRKKKRRRRRFMRRILKILCVLAVLTFVICLIYIAFQVKKINVKGNQYTASQDVVEWIKKDRFSDNALYIFFKYNNDIEQLPSVESVKVRLSSPWVVEVQVKEKKLAGGIKYGKKTLYFDAEGIASLITEKKIEDIPYIEGVEVEEEKVQLGKKIPVENDWIYQQISEISSGLDELELSPDRIAYEDAGISLYFGEIRVLIGKDAFEEKLQQITPILKELNEQYAKLTGTLHLENYDIGDSMIRFVPDTKIEDTKKNEDENENQIQDENLYYDVYGDSFDWTE